MKDTYWEQCGDEYQFVKTKEIDALTDLILNQAPESVFEAAVGTGIIIKTLREKGYKGKYLGTDYADGFLESARKNNPGEIFAEQDLYFPMPGQDKGFDVSVVHHGIEYVYPYETAFKELARITKKKVIISMWIPLVEGGNKIRFNEEGKWNVNYYEREEFIRTLEKYFIIDVEAKVVNNENGKSNYWYILTPL